MKSFNPRARRCPICDEPCKKEGKIAAGSQRWYCKNCRYSFTSTRTDQQKLAQLREFCDYVTDTEPKRCLAGWLRTWDRDHAWCWDTPPVWEPTGEVYDQIFIDGTYIAHSWCVLIAATTDGVIDYQLCHQESKAAYTSLLKRILAPQVVT
ncbi:IS1/IS1595 family N-terminal zinc-binding domain-containing protein, partial [Trueperella pyogenes]|uniref:IS1/IS1595 family N-terminal zinc-binding domain-containing protein n=1 Tax=Trueperella pyogenes TaxID=1661 RepID=UPI00346EBD99